MSGNNKHTEDLFNDLFKSQGLEKAPIGFADKVMFAIEKESVSVPESGWSLSGWWIWVSISLGIAGLIAAVFLIDFSFMGSIFNGIELDGSRMSQFVNSMGSGAKDIFTGLSFSSLSITIFIAIVALFAIERMFRRKTKVEIHFI